MRQITLGIGLAFLTAATCQPLAAQEPDDGSPRLVQLTDSVFRVVHRPGAATAVAP